jgi:hypothetical protein
MLVIHRQVAAMLCKHARRDGGIPFPFNMTFDAALPKGHARHFQHVSPNSYGAVSAHSDRHHIL